MSKRYCSRLLQEMAYKKTVEQHSEGSDQVWSSNQTTLSDTLSSYLSFHIMSLYLISPLLAHRSDRASNEQYREGQHWWSSKSLRLPQPHESSRNFDLQVFAVPSNRLCVVSDIGLAEARLQLFFSESRIKPDICYQHRFSNHQTIPIGRWRQKVDMLEEAKDHNVILRARLLRKRNYARLAWVLSALGIYLDMVDHHVNPPHSSQGLAKMEKKFSAPVFITHGHANRDPILKVEREMDHTTRYLRPCRISATPTAHHFGHFEVSLRITSIMQLHGLRPTKHRAGFFFLLLLFSLPTSILVIIG
ncbi:hypothetical protein J3E68DRAFT_219672 [Trichoderma sp. SZMC 28012]